jgi:subtilase family serine protease
MMTRADGLHGMSPGDFATIYNVTSLWNQGFDGKGQSIAIVAQSNIQLSDVTNFRAQFGLPVNNPQIIIVPGSNPGITSAEVEADLDVEWAGAIAKNATINLVVAKTAGQAALYVINNNVAPIVSVSFGLCESSLGPAATQAFGSLWQQAAAQGMSVFVSSGDSGSAGCDNPNSSLIAQTGLGVNGLASSPNNVAVGGTRFNDNPVYWNKTNNFFNLSSARGYIPENVWNDGLGLWSTGGGVSAFWPQPSWQVGLGVPAADPGTTTGHHRYLPDISLAASVYGGYVIREEGHLGFVGGTSASTPAFAGIMAIINQMTGQTNGNPNPRLYAIANQFPSIFHDVTTGSNAVPCAPGSVACSNGLTIGYPATVGYDLATGWGSVDAYALAHAWRP